MITGQPADITRSLTVAPEWQVWRCAFRRGELDESVILPGWLPSGPDWEDVTADIQPNPGPAWGHDGRGQSGTFTVYGSDWAAWPDSVAVCIVARHYDGSDFSDWDVAAWGYIVGSGRQTLPALSRPIGTLRFDYAGFWDKQQMESVRFGRPNLASGATVVNSSTALATPASEAPLEYVSQATCSPENATDGNIDTVAVFNVIAGRSRPAIGSTMTPVIQRAYGSFTRGIAPGGQPRFVELGVGYDLAAAWGNMETSGAIPALFEGNGTAFRNDDVCHTYLEEELADPGNHVYVVEAKAQPTNPRQRHGPQWNFTTGKRPLGIHLRYKAWDGDSVGKIIHITAGGDHALRLTAAWQDFDVDISGPDAIHDVLVFRIQGGDNNADPALALSTRTIFAFDDFRLSLGYSDMENQRDSGYKLCLAIDDGAGHEHVRRIAWDIDGNTEEWTIGPDSTVVITDNAAAFRAKFDPGSRPVWELGKLFPDWYFGVEGGVGVGRMKLCYAISNVRDDYDHPDLITVHEVDFSVANGGAPWLEHQALARQSPALTGLLAPEDFPHVGLTAGAYGTAFCQWDLGAYVPTYLTVATVGGDTAINVDDPDELPDSGGGAYIDTDEFTYTGKSGRTLTGVTGILAHDAGIATGAVYPKVSGAKQTAPLVDLVELRRKPGKPQIIAGAIIYSALGSPGNPSVPDGLGGVWERHQDWKLLNRWNFRQGDPDTITTIPDGGWVQMRHIAIIIDEMAQYNGYDQRAKLNELVVRKYSPASSTFSGRQTGTLVGVVGYLLTQLAGVPLSKVYAVTDAPPPIHDYSIAPTTVGQAIASVASQGFIAVRLDKYNRAFISWTPNTPGFAPEEADWQWQLSDLRGDPSGDWAEAYQVSQVRVAAKEVATYRLHKVVYPPIARPLGAVLELKDVLVNTGRDATLMAQAQDRRGNHRRSITLPVGACPWLEVHQRHILALPELDEGGAWNGQNVYVESFDVKTGVTDGVPTWTTSVALRELSIT